MTQWGVDAVFNPASRFAEEEKRRLKDTRHEVSVSDPSSGRRVDAGAVRVRISRLAPDEGYGPDDGAAAAGGAAVVGEPGRAG